MPDPSSIVEGAKQTIADDDSEIGRKTALVTGSVALGALLTGSLFRRIRHLKLEDPADLEPALDADVGTFEIMEGRTRFYVREGTGVPVVLLHSINAAASSYEMKPIFEHMAANTERPLYALDWFGFGRSDRPPVRYGPSMYIRQLRRFLSERVHQPADLVALSLSCEYAAEVARTLPYLVRHLILVAPTGLSEKRPTSAWQRAAISIANSVGVFEIFFFRLTRHDVLRRFYQRQVFRRSDVPDDLVAYANRATRVRGAHHAARYFVQGLLSTGSAAMESYIDLRVPTLVAIPADGQGLIQQFDRADDLASRNPEFICIAPLQSGLMPHWETPGEFFDAIAPYLNPP